MSGIQKILIFTLLVSLTAANYNGPYLFWGPPRLESLENSALNGLNEEVLKNIYVDSKAVIIFVKNSSHPMTSEHYPSLENLLADRKSAYMSQSVLIYDPMDLNLNTEVIVLSGTPEQEDIELCALFRDAEINYGENKVLGILANSQDMAHHRQRRQAVEFTTELPLGSSSTIPPSTTAEPSSNTVTEDHIYYLAGKGAGTLFYTSDPPMLVYADGPSYQLKKHLMMTVDERDKYMRLSLKYIVREKEQLRCTFRVDISGGYWTLTSVEIDDGRQPMTLPVIGKNPSAPLMPAYSYRCSRPLVFGNENMTLTMQNIQLQPKLNGDKKFGPAIDCVGFMSTPILSGIFVSIICLIVLGISLTAILDIKAPNRFENSRSKALTFTVQE